MICSITSSGLLMPPDQNAFQTPSILLFNSPVITALTIVTAADATEAGAIDAGQRLPSDLAASPGISTSTRARTLAIAEAHPRSARS